MADELQLGSGSDQIGRDVQKSSNAVPLLPQWLLTKTGDNKAGMVVEENSSNLFPGCATHQDAAKLSGIVSDSDENHEKKDVFRPSILDAKAARWDRWRDDERGANFSIRKDQWREGEREYSDARRVARKGDLPIRQYGEARRAPGERRSDSGNRDSHDQRRESKWNTRWGRDEKETSTVHEKWGDVTNEDDTLHDRPSHLLLHGKEEREGELYRPWRGNSSYGRGRSDVNHPISTPSKHVPTHSHALGRGETASSNFSIGRGRFTSGDISFTPSFGNMQSPKVESDHGAPPYPLCYSRTKLIDVFRTTDVLSHKKFLLDAIQVPSITLDMPVEPLALCTPSPQELAVFSGIDKGEISSSGAPKMNKPAAQWHGNKDDLPSSLDDTKDETWDHPDGSSHEKQNHGWSSSRGGTVLESQSSADLKLTSEALVEGSSVRVRNNDFPEGRGFTAPGNSSFLHSGAVPSSSFRERSHPVPIPAADVHGRSNSAWETNAMDFTNTRIGETKWPVGGSPVTRMQPSASFGKARDQPNSSQTSPEDMILFYKDPQGDIQGPFSGSDIITWFESGYFGLDLQVRLTSSSVDSPFSLLGDVMPHLKLKARPPPGFSTGKPNEIQELSGKLNHSTHGKFLVESEANLLKNDSGYKCASSTEAENRFLESLMGGSVPGALPVETLHPSGIHSYGVKNSFSMPSLAPSSGDDPHRIQKLMLERQKSLQNPYPLWPAIDAASLSLSTEGANETSAAQVKLLSSNFDNVQPQLPQNMEPLAHPTLVDRPASVVNTGISGRVPFLIQGGSDLHLEKLDVQQTHGLPMQAAFGIQQQRLHSHNQAMSPFLTPPAGNSPVGLAPEKLLALQQQYLLQSHSHAPVQSQQLSFLEKLLLLNQQQKQEELHLMRQQQQLLSQLISEQHNNQILGDASLTQQQGVLSVGIPTSDHSQFQNQHDLSQISSQSAASNPFSDVNATNLVYPPVSHDISLNAGLEVMHPLHHIQENSEKQDSWSATPTVQIDEEQKIPGIRKSFDPEILSATKNKSVLDQTLNSAQVDNSLTGSSFFSEESSVESAVPQEPSIDKDIVVQQVSDTLEVVSKTSEVPNIAKEQKVSDSPLRKEIKNAQAHEGKKSSDKKSRKQKSSKNSIDTVRSTTKANMSMASEVKATNCDGKSESLSLQEDLLVPSFSENTEAEKVLDDLDFQMVRKTADANVSMTLDVESVPQEAHLQVGRNAWKHAPDFRPKSLLEIQEEEQRRSQLEIRKPEISAPAGSTSISSPWTGVLNPDRKLSNEIEQKSLGLKLNLVNSDNLTALSNKKTLEDDLFWDSGTEKTGDRALERLLSNVSLQADSSVENDFIEAKDTKKGRKKSAKAKPAVAKASSVAVDMPFGSSPVEKGKYTLQMQQQNEVHSAIPSGPSLGDFVLWKGEPASPPVPVWSANQGKTPKPASLRDILKEQEKKISSPLPVPTPKPTINRPIKTASPVQTSFPSGSNPKQNADSDLFWEPLEQPRREDKKSNFPELGAQVSLVGKGTASKVTLGGPLNQKKSTAGKFPEPSISFFSASQSLQAGKKATSSKHSEALDFKKWCESECIRLIGSKDTSILEYCLKISRSEAETLLIENLASVDPSHEFIDKFLNYKDFLPADAVEAAFKNRNIEKNPTIAPPENRASDQLDVDWDANSRGKKKGKKGKKVSPSILGFNVVSNRIMMGEIQTVDD